MKSEQQLKEEVKFASIEELKLNPNNLVIVQDELMQMEKTRVRDTV